MFTKFPLVCFSSCLIFFFFWCNRPHWTRASSYNTFLDNTTTTHHSRYGSSRRVISSSQRPLPDITQHSQQTDIHVPGGIRIHTPSRRAVADLRLRPRDHWDRWPLVFRLLYSLGGKRVFHFT